MMTAIFGGDISLSAIDRGAIPKIDEYRMRNLLDNMIATDGKIKSYSVNSGNLRRQFLSPGEDLVRDFLVGSGLRWSRAKLGNVGSQAVERNIFSSIRVEDVFWPADFLTQPLGSGTKQYNSHEVIEMIYDMEEHSMFEQLFDQFQILSEQPNQGFVVSSQIINTMVAYGLRREIFNNAGDLFTYCISSDKWRTFGELKYKPNTC